MWPTLNEQGGRGRRRGGRSEGGEKGEEEGGGRKGGGQASGELHPGILWAPTPGLGQGSAGLLTLTLPLLVPPPASRATGGCGCAGGAVSKPSHSLGSSGRVEHLATCIGNRTCQCRRCLWPLVQEEPLQVLSQAAPAPSSHPAPSSLALPLRSVCSMETQ